MEKFNWTLGQELAKYYIEGQMGWDQKLPVLLMAYHSAEHESPLYTLAKLMTGHELMGRPPDEGLPEDAPTYVRELFDRLQEVHHQVRENVKLSGEVMKPR